VCHGGHALVSYLVNDDSAIAGSTGWRPWVSNFLHTPLSPHECSQGDKGGGCRTILPRTIPPDNSPPVWGRTFPPNNSPNILCIHTYTCMHIHTYTYIHTHTYIYTHTYTHTYTYIHIHTYIYMHTNTCIHIHTYIYIHTYTSIHTHTSVCMYASILSMYVRILICIIMPKYVNKYHCI